jgi:hypothetical protein
MEPAASIQPRASSTSLQNCPTMVRSSWKHGALMASAQTLSKRRWWATRMAGGSRCLHRHSDACCALPNSHAAARPAPTGAARSSEPCSSTNTPCSDTPVCTSHVLSEESPTTALQVGHDRKERTRAAEDGSRPWSCPRPSAACARWRGASGRWPWRVCTAAARAVNCSRRASRRADARCTPRKPSRATSAPPCRRCSTTRRRTAATLLTRDPIQLAGKRRDALRLVRRCEDHRSVGVARSRHRRRCRDVGRGHPREKRLAEGRTPIEQQPPQALARIGGQDILRLQLKSRLCPGGVLRYALG